MLFFLSIAILLLIGGLFFSSYYKNELKKVKTGKSLLILSMVFSIVAMFI